jgi:putative NADH-flavin reductase
MHLLAFGLAWTASPRAVHIRAAAHATHLRTSTPTAFFSRRETLGAAVALGTSTLVPPIAMAAGPKKVMVAGATGQTGRRVLERLAAIPGLTSVGAVRNVDKAKQSLASSSTVVRGAMLDKVSAMDASSVSFAALDLQKDSVETMSAALKGVDALIIAVGFVPGNPFKMDAAAHAVDNVGTVALIDAAKKAGVSKVVLLSSILTDGPAWGQEKSPGYQVIFALDGWGVRGGVKGEGSEMIDGFAWGQERSPGYRCH